MMIDAYTIVESLKASGFDERKTKDLSAVIQTLKSDIVTKDYLQDYIEAAVEKHWVKNLLAQILIAGVIIVAIRVLQQPRDRTDEEWLAKRNSVQLRRC